MGIFVTVFSLALVVGLLVLIVGASRRRHPGTPGIDARSVRRFFQYVLMFALWLVVAIGATELLGRLFGAEPAQWEDTDYALAQALAFVIVGLPLTLGLAWWTWRRHRADPAEASSNLYAAYVTLTALAGALMAATSLQELLARAIDPVAFDGDAAGGLLAWGALWAGHWIVAKRSLDEDRRVPHLLLGSVLGLVLATAGTVLTLGTALDLLLRPGEILGGTLALAEGVSLLVAGAVVWVLYWVMTAIRLPRGTLWLVYALPVGVGGGLVLTLVAASRLLWSVLVWFLGDRGGTPAVRHFASATTEVAAILTGALVWWYHRTIVGEGRESRTEVRRVYEYLVSGIALITAATGVGTMLVALIESATPGIDLGMPVRNTLLAAITLLVVGVPVWWVFWRSIRGAVATEPEAEVASLTRRVYVVVLFGVAGIAAVVALITVAFTFFQDVVAAQVSGTTLRSMRYGLGVLIGAAAISAYHGAVFRQDRQVEVPGRDEGPRSVVLVGVGDPELDHAITRATGARVEVWGRLDGVPAAWDAERVLAALAGHRDEDLLVIEEGGDLRVLVVDPSGARWGQPPQPSFSE